MKCSNNQGKTTLADHFTDPLWGMKVAYLADIFEQFNSINRKMQGRDTYIHMFNDVLRAFGENLQNWWRKVCTGNVAMFSDLDTVVGLSKSSLDEALIADIFHNLSNLDDEVRI